MKFIRKYDFFGHPVHFNYSRDGPTNNTVCGGIFSILIILVIANLAVFKCITMIQRGDDKILSFENLLDQNEDNEISFDELDYLPVYWLSYNKRLGNGIPNEIFGDFS
jgi:hypothetical protein